MDIEDADRVAYDLLNGRGDRDNEELNEGAQQKLYNQGSYLII